MITLSDIIGQALEKGGATQEALADKAKISQARLSELLNGKGLPRLRAIPDLAAALGYDAKDLARVIESDRRRAHARIRTKAGAR